MVQKKTSKKAKHTKADTMTKHTTHSSKKKQENNNNKYIMHSIIVVIAIILLIFVFKNIFTNEPSKNVVATFDSTQITLDELNKAYDKLPAEFQAMITKEQYLEELYVPQRIILEKAKIISDKRIEDEFNNFLEMSGQTKEDIEQALEKNNVTEKEFMESLKIQIFLNDTLYDKIEITDDDLLNFYEANKENILDDNGDILAFEDIKSDIDAFLRNQKLQEETTKYLEDLKSTMDIKIYAENIVTATEEKIDEQVELTDSSFDSTGDDLCTEDGKPIIRMFSTTWCPHCKWIKPIFEKIVAPYVETGKIIAYSWELDINDNTLTEVKETTIPQSEMAIYQKYNPQGSIPTFVLGCKYSRIGNGYEGQSDGEAKEIADFTQIIEELIA